MSVWTNYCVWVMIVRTTAGIPPNCLKALGALSKHPEAGWPMYSAVSWHYSHTHNHHILPPHLTQLQGAVTTLSTPSPRKLGYTVPIQVERRVWDLPECPKFFQSLQFTAKPNSGSAMVTLEASGARLDRKVVHLASVALLAVFGK